MLIVTRPMDASFLVDILNAEPSPKLQVLLSLISTHTFSPCSFIKSDRHYRYINTIRVIESTFPLSTDCWELSSPCLLYFKCKSGFCENYKCAEAAMFTFASFIMNRNVLADDIMVHHKLLIELLCNERQKA